jgi:hypothetical protein
VSDDHHAKGTAMIDRTFCRLALAGLAAVAGDCRAQAIDFETLPDGTATVDRELISDQYQAAFGVRFDIVDGLTLVPIGSPQIAKVGAPQTAFAGCGPDTPLDGEGVGDSFITDDSQIANSAGSLLLTYDNPVSAVCGVILDVDRRGPNTFEQWTIEALDASMQVIETQVITAPIGPDVCRVNYGPGDARALGFAFDRASTDICYLVMRYTGNATGVGLAFDQFFPDSVPAAPTVTVDADVIDRCFGDTVLISTHVVGGLPGIRYRWQAAAPGEGFLDVPGETRSTFIAPALPDHRYRVIVSDTLAREAASEAVTIGTVRAVVFDLLSETAAGSGVFTPVALGVEPFDFDSSISNVFNWSGAQQYYHGAQPTLVQDRSHLFLSRGPGGQAVTVVHDARVANGGGRAEMQTVFTGVTPVFLAQDDPGDFYSGEGTDTLIVRSDWSQPNTDGWAAGPLEGSWTATVRFTDAAPGSPVIEGLTDWVFVSGDGTVYTLPLEEDRAVRIEARCSCPADLASPFGTLNFFDLAAFIGLYSASDPDADLAAPFGVFNFFDVAAYIALYNAGCP